MKIKYTFKHKQPRLLSFLIVAGHYPVKFIYKQRSIILASQPQAIKKIRLDQKWNQLVKKNHPDKVLVYE